MSCRYCGFRQGGHSPQCPESSPRPTAARAVWKAGWDDGRIAEPRRSHNPLYVLGHLRGEVALEEAENGCDWVSN